MALIARKWLHLSALVLACFVLLQIGTSTVNGVTILKRQSFVAVLTLALLSGSLPAFAQTTATQKQVLSGRLQAAGGIGPTVGVAMMLGTGENNRSLDDTYCVRSIRWIVAVAVHTGVTAHATVKS